MSDSTEKVGPVDWSEGMTATAKRNTLKKGADAAADIAKGDSFYLRAAEKLELIYRLYLKGDRKRFEAFVALAPLSLNGSMGYVYVQAARAGKTFATDIAKVTSSPVSLQSLAKLDRFTADDESIAKGREIIASEGAAAKVDGRKPLTQTALQNAVSAAGTGEASPDRAEKRIGNIAMKLRDSLRSAFAAAGGGDETARAAFVAAVKVGAEYGAKHGAATPLALDRLSREWKVEIVAATIEAKKVQADAAKLAADLATVNPATKPAAKPAATVKPAGKPAAKRSGRNVKPAGLPNVAAAVKQSA